MNAFREHHEHSIRASYRCFDRILLNGLLQPLQQPEAADVRARRSDDMLRCQRQAMRKKRKQRTTVTVFQASSVELTKRASSNSLRIEVRSGEEFLGTLYMGRGSVQWWPNGNKTNDFRMSWKRFARLLETEMAGK